MTTTDQDIERAREWWKEHGLDLNFLLRRTEYEGDGDLDAAECLAQYADHVTADLRQQLDDKDAEIGRLKKELTAAEAQTIQWHGEYRALEERFSPQVEAAVRICEGDER